jgi:protein-tyrosine phosphatase
MQADLYPIKGPWPGQMAIVARPRGADWLIDEVQSWRQAGLDVVVSLLTDSENVELGLTEESNVTIEQGMDFVSFPIEDYSVPSSEESVLNLTSKLIGLLVRGKRVGIHCRQSVGRSGLIAACLLVGGGETPAAAFEHVKIGRRAHVPDTTEQREWVYSLAARLNSQTDLSIAK